MTGDEAAPIVVATILQHEQVRQALDLIAQSVGKVPPDETIDRLTDLADALLHVHPELAAEPIALDRPTLRAILATMVTGYRVGVAMVVTAGETGPIH